MVLNERKIACSTNIIKSKFSLGDAVMRKINENSSPHLFYCRKRMLIVWYCSLAMRIIAKWWKVKLGRNCKFHGFAMFYRTPGSEIYFGHNSTFNSSHSSNLIGVNRPCIISTQKPGATIKVGNNCGFSGTVISCAKSIKLGNNVRCGANTLMTDTDWHTDDPRTSPDAEIIIGDNVWLGEGVKILKGVTIGSGALIAAGSIVTKDVTSNCLYAGIPAKFIKEFKIDE